MISRLTIDQLGTRGEGVAQGPDGLIFVPYALAGETLVAEVDGSRGTLVEVLTPSPNRKRDLVVSALRQAGLANEVSDLADAHGAGCRRATFWRQSISLLLSSRLIDERP
jgi:23S rRNA (uracil1939-C5)-methyltransferase